MGLRWVTISGALSLGYAPDADADIDHHLGRVRRPRTRPNAWEAHYDRLGLPRHDGLDEDCRIGQLFSSPAEAKDAVDRRHDELVDVDLPDADRPPAPGRDGRPLNLPPT